MANSPFFNTSRNIVLSAALVITGCGRGIGFMDLDKDETPVTDLPTNTDSSSDTKTVIEDDPKTDTVTSSKKPVVTDDTQVTVGTEDTLTATDTVDTKDTNTPTVSLDTADTDHTDTHTGSMDTNHTDTQTDSMDTNHTDTQTDSMDTDDAGTGTDLPDTDDAGTGTDLLDTDDTDTQTESVEPDDYECNIDIDNGISNCANRVLVWQSENTAAVGIDLTGYTSMTLTADICNPTDYVLNIGNSPGNDCGSGDYGEFSNDSELCVEAGTNLFVFRNDYAGTLFEEKMIYMDNGFLDLNGCVTRTITISDGKVRLIGDDDITTNSEHLFRLNQPDLDGTPDALLFVGLNRAVNLSIYPNRTGTGVKFASIRLSY